MDRCVRCVLPTTFPGVSLDEAGVCTHCRRYRPERENDEAKRAVEERFRALIREHRGRAAYDVVMAYSGGKDSTYTLDLFVNRYQLRVLALSLDNGFISQRAFQNIRQVCDNLGVDSLVVRPAPAPLKKIFRVAAEEELYAGKTLERASTICTSCIGLVKGVILRTAVEKRIPFVGFGWSPGQAPLQAAVMKTNPALMRSTQRAILGPLQRIAGEAVKPYFLADSHFAAPESFPWNVHPLAFLPYDEASIVTRDRQLGWVKPVDTDPNSTNCLLNAYANQVHRDRYGFHPYVWEIANLVRGGAMTRDEGLAKVEVPEDQRMVERAQQALAG